MKLQDMRVKIVTTESDDQFIDKIKSKYEDVSGCKIKSIEPIKNYGLSLFLIRFEQLSDDTILSLAGKEILDDYMTNNPVIIKEISIKLSFDV